MVGGRGDVGNGMEEPRSIKAGVDETLQNVKVAANSNLGGEGEVFLLVKQGERKA